VILVPQKYTAFQLHEADLKRNEFRRSRYTSGSANLDNMIALNKAVILCPEHTRKFVPKRARYRAHPDSKLQRVNGQCDVCRSFELCFLFLCERDAQAEQVKVEKFKRGLEYAHFHS
jgi:hypothetical protein